MLQSKTAELIVTSPLSSAPFHVASRSTLLKHVAQLSDGCAITHTQDVVDAGMAWVNALEALSDEGSQVGPARDTIAVDVRYNNNKRPLTPKSTPPAGCRCRYIYI